MHFSTFTLAAFLLFAASGSHAAAGAGASAHPVHAEAHGAAPRQLAKRDALMKLGAENLAAGNADAAANAFDSAVSMVHAPDAELGLVRSYMQAGHYRQALSSSAHTAGAHKEEPQGAALYAWLLHVGGQEAAAKRILLEAQARTPGSAILGHAARWMDASSTTSSASPGAATAFAPYSLPPVPAAPAVTAGSGVLIDGGRHALVPLASLAHAGRIWLRNGLGQTRKAMVAIRYQKEGLVLLRLEPALPQLEGFMIAGSAPFPGSVVYSTEYSAVRDAQPEWPVLRHGFLGTPVGHGLNRELGIPLQNGPHGGPVFDASGALTGIAISGSHGEAVLLPISRIRQALGDRLGPVAPPMNGPRVAIEQVYENAIRVTLQVLTAR